ncbi:hypothetical protein GQ53DRAFT_879398 [Thozetella sp. PMI_491]|nr:hypothetical protein GQ53DRAFT_879398 [Thozetella sp. PMI_491]
MEAGQVGPGLQHDSNAGDLASAQSGSPLEAAAPLSPLSPQSPDSEPENTRAKDHDSLVTVRLSEPPSLHINTVIASNVVPSRRTMYGTEYTPTDAMAEVVQEEDDDNSEAHRTPTPASEHGTSLQDELEKEQEREGEQEEEDETQLDELRQSTESEEVNWDQLQQTEDQESKEKDSENSTAMLLARLEQENVKIATNPKSIKVQVVPTQQPSGRRPRPPSMAQLREMVNGPTPAALRYSMLPPPPMTDLEFYMALVKDYQQTAARLPTLLSNKIRKGIPPPLRGVVWQSMTGARDGVLEEAFDRLSGESSPYEGIIGKDLNRSFPGVDMFRDPDGDGQRMLGRVLKCFSLYDAKIGYCQGLAFLVGPLLMHMPDKQAFCVLVRLMENYDLRHCFVPDLSGLHVRIFQFRELLRQLLPTVSDHLDDLQVDPAYVSQWFLSFFAVTCPLPMLFRIYDVVFAEGASETVMRVALSLMRKNETRILACSELEDAMQLLLSRGLWDCYHYNADEFVLDFVSLSDVVSRERLAALEQAYREAQINNANPKNATPNAASEVTTAAAASTFLGRLWSVSTPRLASFAQSLPSGPISPSTTTVTSSTLSPGLVAPSRPLSMLRRSASKQSLASTLNSMEAASTTTSSSAASVLSSASTEATSISRDSNPSDDLSRESAPALGGANSKTGAAPPNTKTANTKDDEKYLHSQIEDLLTALTELQRNNALLASQLQKEKEDRDEDKKAVQSLLDGLRKKAGGDATDGSAPEAPTPEQLSGLLDTVESRFTGAADSPRSSNIPQTKTEMRDELARAKEQLANEVAKTLDFNRRIAEIEREMTAVKEQLRDSHAHVRNMHTERQRLEKQMQGLRARASDTPHSTLADAGEWLSKAAGLTTSVPAPGGGLRELKLGRSKSTPTQGPGPFNKRASSIMLKTGVRESIIGAPPQSAPVGEHEALLLELVQAKTAEAIAKQEAEEAKQKLESLRKAFGLAPGDPAPASQANTMAANAASQASVAASAAASAAMGMFSRFTSQAASAPASATAPAPAATDVTPKPAVTATPAPPTSTAATTTAASTGGGFWGWRR